MSRIEDYKYTSLEARTRISFRNPEWFALSGKENRPQAVKAREYTQLPLPEPVPMIEGQEVIFPLETAQPAPRQERINPNG